MTSTLTQEIRFAITDCKLGRLLAAVTDRGVCGVAMGDDDESVIDGLQAWFPAEELVSHDSGVLSKYLDAMCGLVEGKRFETNLPLDLQGTPFQLRVWEALRNIPRGTTTTYSTLARHLNCPGAVRAVGMACGSNRLAILIPCHRVLRQDGNLGGFRWGLERKRALLQIEGVSASLFDQ